MARDSSSVHVKYDAFGGSLFTTPSSQIQWFHRPFRADDWCLFEIDSPSTSGGRGLSRGSVFSSDGQLVSCLVLFRLALSCLVVSFLFSRLSYDCFVSSFIVLPCPALSCLNRNCPSLHPPYVWFHIIHCRWLRWRKKV